MNTTIQTTMPVKTGKYKKNVKVNLTYTNTHITIGFGYTPTLLPDIKALTGAKWLGHDGGPKLWQVHNNQHNRFQLDYLQGKPVYARYDAPLIHVEAARAPRYNKIARQEFSLYDHQTESVDFIATRRQCILAEEMGLGKSLAVILAMEYAACAFGWDMGSDGLPSQHFIYVAPKSVLATVRRQLYEWGSKVYPHLLTYDELVKWGKDWNNNPARQTPHFLTLDESSMVKTPTSQRSQAAAGFADGMRDDYGDEAFVVLMTGTPAPKSPEDWWMQARIARPGFLKEGDPGKLKRRLAVVKMMNSPMTGGMYPKLLGWKDNPAKCDVCGQLKDSTIHDLGFEIDSHVFVPSVNEIELLYRRLKGLVLVKMKKDCLNLPDKIDRIIEIKPDRSTMRTAALIAKTSPTTIEALTRLRELSDGFQYNQTKTGEKICPDCNGNGVGVSQVEVPNSCPYCKDGLPEGADHCLSHQPQFTRTEGTCHLCDGKKMVPVYSRTVTRVDSPKDRVLRDLLEENEDIGRVVIFAGFTESVDRCVDLCHKEGWTVIRIDGRGWDITDASGMSLKVDPLSLFQDQLGTHPKVAWVGHPGSGGFSHTLTKASMVIYFSNDFNGTYRSQSEDRIHRIGMDPNRGAVIVDLIHLPTDLKVRDNLRTKRRLELITLGEVEQALAMAGEER